MYSCNLAVPYSTLLVIVLGRIVQSYSRRPVIAIEMPLYPSRQHATPTVLTSVESPFLVQQPTGSDMYLRVEKPSSVRMCNLQRHQLYLHWLQQRFVANERCNTWPLRATGAVAGLSWTAVCAVIVVLFGPFLSPPHLLARLPSHLPCRPPTSPVHLGPSSHLVPCSVGIVSGMSHAAQKLFETAMEGQTRVLVDITRSQKGQCRA